MGEKQRPTYSHYAELNRCSQNGEYERALKVANKILGVSPDEILALHCKLICLIQLSKFDEAIALINRNPHYLKDILFEKAYCYYRANKPADALKILNKSEDELDLRCKELKAQILYRLEKYDEAAKMYHENIKSTNDDYEEERYTNLSAVMVFLNRNDTENQIDYLKDNTYELCYNKACILIAHENYTEAEKKLKQCEKLCREALEEDEAAEEEIDIELALIKVQLAYVYQKQGRIREAHQIYTATLKLKIEDMALIAAASNNVVCINKDQNLFDSKKKMKAAMNEALVYKLPSRQRKYIALNNAILNYYVNQTEICEKICKNIEDTYPDLMIQILILRALNLIKADKVKEAIELLKNTEREDNRLYLHLCIAQIHLMQVIFFLNFSKLLCILPVICSSIVHNRVYNDVVHTNLDIFSFSIDLISFCKS
ncbi:unnamed protein product [Acanthoscelides obtectus]|uniref:Signal recognition particle subunit SRP72 n=2 Tax=Acanthoscelides obtectus TaxID=200917 RepID=A0A9P0LRS0_ACAOB|nr:unnamed protein product [Acanthoscelides obtectus]CAK1628326.1 Signal recognition particle subunit SRP72 [Acanthoscelides obtectus]